MLAVKMQEGGTEYWCVDCMDGSMPSAVTTLEPASVLILEPSLQADVRLRVLNPDGVLVATYGDGLCCAATFLYEHGLTQKSELTIETAERVWYLDLITKLGKPLQCRIDLGQPILEAARIPTLLPGNPPVEIPMTWPDTVLPVTSVGVGGAWAVLFVHELSDDLVHQVGSQLEHHSLFPQGTSVAFVKRNQRDDVSVRVWRRDLGEQRSCVAAAGAVVVAGSLSGRTDGDLNVHMPGGSWHAHWQRQADDHIAVTGSAIELLPGKRVLAQTLSHGSC